MPVGAAVGIAGGSIGSALIGSSAASSAADKQAQSQANALSLQQQMFQQTQANYKPYLDTGKAATYSLGSLYGLPGADGSVKPPDFSGFTNSPDFGFAQQQGELGLARAENARGMNLSGGALKDISQFNTGLATQQFGNYFSRLMQLSQLGGNAASAAGGNAQNFSGQMSNSITGQGQATASGIVGSANALTGGINSGISNSLLYNAINRSSYGGNNVGFGTNPSNGGWLGNTGFTGWMSP